MATRARARTAAPSAAPAAKRAKGGAGKKPPRQQQADAAKPEREPTSFELRMHKVCKQIPAGRVSTYGALATVLGSSPRAVGQALRRNPYAPAVPCHRVITSDLQMGGFSGSWGTETPEVQKKRALLESEGVKFDGARLADNSVVMAPEDF